MPGAGSEKNGVGDMAGINVRDLRDDLSFGSIIEGVNWDNIDDEGVRQQILRRGR